jgi:3-oxoadipate enol-lactonase
MKAQLNDIALHYNEHGARQGIPIIFIHGFPFNHKMWEPQIQHLPNDIHAIVYDVRGHGSSDVGDGQFTIELFTDDLIALLDHLSLDKAVLCGLSMGGYIALRAVEKYPDRISGLVLCDTKSESDTDEAKVKRTVTMNKVKVSGVKYFADDFVTSIFCENTFRHNPATIGFIKKIICENSPLGICGTLLALASRTNTTLTLPSISVPTCIITGEQDKLTPPSVMQAIHAAIKNSEIHILSDAGHMTNLENSKTFNEKLFAFLKKYR